MGWKLSAKKSHSIPNAQISNPIAHLKSIMKAPTKMHFLVAFANAEESRETVSVAVQLAAATQSSLTLLKVIPNPHSVGVVAELIATDEPFLLAHDELQSVVHELMHEDIDAKAEVRSADEVGKGIVSAAIDLAADLVFLGTRNLNKPLGLPLDNDPVAHYVVNHCPANIVLVRSKS